MSLKFHKMLQRNFRHIATDLISVDFVLNAKGFFKQVVSPIVRFVGAAKLWKTEK
jgi:hypothetical protein